MNFGKSFWSLGRRDLFKLLPPGLASWALTSPLLTKPAGNRGAVPAPTAGEAKIWRADWIWEPVQMTRQDMSPGVPLFQNRPFKNLFTFFRKTFDQPWGVNKAIALISADSRYKLYVNGEYVGRGPARCDQIWQYYDEYDIASFLRPGINVIAAVVHYYGERTGWYVPGRPGFLFECSVESAGGESSLVKSDDTWKSLRAPMWTQDVPRVNDSLGFVEIYDAQRDIDGWNLPEFDDAQWQQVQIISPISGDQPPLNSPYPWENLVPRDIPMFLEEEVAPAAVTMIGEVQNLAPGLAQSPAHQMSLETPGPLKNCTVEDAKSLTTKPGGAVVIRTTPLGESEGRSAVLVLDFGREVTGYPRLELEGVQGGIIDMGVSESLTQGRVTPTHNGLHGNRYVMKNGFQRWEAFEWDGFRYLQLTIRYCPRPVKLRKVALNFTSYPVGRRGAFESSDALLNKIWEMSRYTVQLCMQDGYTADANREQRQWVGDAYVETKVNYAVFGDAKLAARLLRQIAQSQRSDGIIMMFYPGDGQSGVLNLFNIKDFVLHWISTIWEYYRFTGDEELVRELYPHAVEALEWFEKRVDARGLLSHITLWVFGDWAPLDRRDRNTILNALFYNALRETAQMAALVGEETVRDRYETLAARVKAAINEHLWDEWRGVYVDSDAGGVRSGRVSQQTNSLCLLYDIASPEKRPGILTSIFDPRRIERAAAESLPEAPESTHHAREAQASMLGHEEKVVQASPFFMHWVNMALAHVGEYDRMVQLLRNLWGPMIEAGATTTWETWSSRASQCHGWSATPAYDLTTYLLGVRGLAPGFRRFVIEPHPAQLEWARGVFPSVQGDIPVSWRSAAGEFHIEGSLPAACAASVLIPLQNGKNARQVHLNRQLVWDASRVIGGAGVRIEAQGVRVPLSQGAQYKIDASY
jgi:hypothetical protein